MVKLNITEPVALWWQLSYGYMKRHIEALAFQQLLLFFHWHDQTTFFFSSMDSMWNTSYVSHLYYSSVQRESWQFPILILWSHILLDILENPLHELYAWMHYSAPRVKFHPFISQCVAVVAYKFQLTLNCADAYHSILQIWNILCHHNRIITQMNQGMQRTLISIDHWQKTKGS